MTDTKINIHSFEEVVDYLTDTSTAPKEQKVQKRESYLKTRREPKMITKHFHFKACSNYAVQSILVHN